MAKPKQKTPSLELLLAAAFVAAAGSYALHQHLRGKAEAEIQEQLQACLQTLPVDKAPEEPPQLACRALYRKLGLDKPIPPPR